MMDSVLPFLKSILSVPGLSAHETPVARLIEGKWKPLLDEVAIGRLGSLHGLKKGHGNDPRPSVMIATHMDAIGLMVTKVVDGFMHITQVGDVDSRVLPGAAVTVHASGSDEDLPAVIAMRPAKLLPEGVGDGVVGFEHLLVDTGLTPGEVERKVRVGDLVSFAYEPAMLAGDVISGHALDNRASIAALTVCLEELQTKPHVWDVWAVATSQEEETYAGAYSSAYELHPQIAVAVDVTFAKVPVVSDKSAFHLGDDDDWRTFHMGQGVPLGLGPNIHPFILNRLKEIADRVEIPWALDVMPAHSDTDAYPMQVTAEGIPTGLVEIPLRYMHTPVESVLIKDIQRAGRLLAEFIASLEADFAERIVWE